MRTARIFLSSLYLLLMVLLPHFHLLFCSHGKAPAQKHAACCHHQEEPQPEHDGTGHSSDHDSCQSCKLLVLSVEAPVVVASITGDSTVISVLPEPQSVHTSLIPFIAQARGPPETV